MSEQKAQEKAASSPKTNKPEKSDSDKKGSDKSATPADSSSSDKTNSAPKSASQTSISHFSSVSTPAYKAGWESIFGGSKNNKKRTSTPANSDQIPEQLTIDDDDIDDEFRSAIFKVFQKKARKQGISLAKIKKKAVLSYTLNCDITEN